MRLTPRHSPVKRLITLNKFDNGNNTQAHLKPPREGAPFPTHQVSEQLHFGTLKAEIMKGRVLVRGVKVDFFKRLMFKVTFQFHMR